MDLKNHQEATGQQKTRKCSKDYIFQSLCVGSIPTLPQWGKLSNGSSRDSCIFTKPSSFLFRRTLKDPKMPYITEKARNEIEAGRNPSNAGELNYVITNIAKQYLSTKGKSYSTMNDIVGALQAASFEFYRRVCSPYEDEKIAENGDVFNSVELAVRDWSTTPGARTKKQGRFSGEEYREILVSHLRMYDKVTVNLDGVAGYGVSWLDEVFTKLIESFSKEYLKAHLTIISKDEPYLVPQIWGFINEVDDA